MPPPLDGIVYIGHPADPAIYYPAGEFHRRLFEHKFCEAVDLLMALGATQITVERKDGMSQEPQVPDHLVWLDSERSWQTLVRARQEHGAAKLGLVLRYESDYGVNADLKAKIEGVGLSLGGRFAEQRDTVWRLDAEFPPA